MAISWQMRAKKLLQRGFFVYFFGTQEAKWMCIIEDADEFEIANVGPCDSMTEAFKLAEQQFDARSEA